MGTKNQTTTNTTSIPSWLSDAYSGLIGKANTLQGSGTYQPYTGGFTSDQQAAFSNIAGLNGTAAPYFNAANQNYTNGVVPASQNVSQYMSPYNQSVINATQQQFNLQNAQQQQGVIGDAIAKGAYGGNRVGVAQAQLAGQQQTAQAPVIAGLYNQNYAQALAAAQAQQQTDLTAAAGQANLGSTAMSTGLSQANAQLAAGTQQQNYDYQQYLNQQSYPYQQLSWLSSIINGTGNVGSTSSTTSPSGNILSELLGTALVGGSLFKRGGRVGYDAGGVVPYSLQSSALQPDGTSFPTYISEGTPYSNGSSGIYLPYIPTGSAGHGNHPMVKAPAAPTDDGSDDPLTTYLKQLAMVDSESRARGGLVRPHLASGGVGDIYGGILQYNPSSGTYGGIYQGAGPAVMLPSSLPSSPSTSFAVAPSTSGGAGGSTYDVGYDPSYPISSAFNGGWGNQATGSVGLGITPDSNGFGLVPNYTPSPGVSAYTYDGSGYTPMTGAGNANAVAAANAQAANDNGDLTYEPAQTGTYAGGDPWAGQRIGGSDYGSTTPGLYTGSNAQPISAGGGKVGILGQGLGLNGGKTGLDRILGINGGSGLFGGGTLLGGFLNSLGGGGGGSGVNTPAPGTSFLNARGVSTSGVNSLAPVAANNLNAQLSGSSHRGSFGVASGGSVGGGNNEGVLPQIDWDHSGFSTLIPTLGKFNYSTKGRPQSANIEDRRPISDDAVISLYGGPSNNGLMSSTQFGAGAPWASDHFSRTGYASGGSPSIADTYYPGMIGNDGLISLQQPITPSINNVAPDASAYADDGSIDPSTDGLVPISGFDPTQYGNDNSGVVPYTTGNQFETTPDQQYSQNIGDVLTSLRNGKGLNLSPDVKQAMLAAGAGMMASKSPFALQGVGEGVLAGVNTWNTRQGIERANAAERAAIAQTGQQIATQAATAQGQLGVNAAQAANLTYEFTPTMGGMLVADKRNPAASQIIPYANFKGWAQQNGIDPTTTPNGGNPPAVSYDTTEGTRFKVSAPPMTGVNGMAMNPVGQQIVQNQSIATLDAARQANQAANDTMLQLDALRNSATNLPTSGFLVPGQWETQRADIAKSLNTISAMTNTPLNFKPETIASIEEMNKLTTQFGFNLAKTTGSDVAASVVTQGIGAVPSIENTPQGFKAITGLIQAGLNRTRDYYAFLNNWAAQRGGDLTGAADYFNTVAPPSVYANAAILSSAIVPKSQGDIDSAPSGTMFNVNGKLMVKK